MIMTTQKWHFQTVTVKADVHRETLICKNQPNCAVSDILKLNDCNHNYLSNLRNAESNLKLGSTFNRTETQASYSTGCSLCAKAIKSDHLVKGMSKKTTETVRDVNHNKEQDGNQSVQPYNLSTTPEAAATAAEQFSTKRNLNVAAGNDDDKAANNMARNSNQSTSLELTAKNREVLILGSVVSSNCCLSLDMRLINSNLHVFDRMAVVEEGDPSDIQLFIKHIEGLDTMRSKVYVKVALENKTENYYRQKTKTYLVSPSGPLVFDQIISLNNIPLRMFGKACLEVSVYSYNMVSSNESLCQLEVRLGDRLEPINSRERWISLFKIMKTKKNRWLSAIVYLN